jgi:hypothetical protein
MNSGLNSYLFDVTLVALHPTRDMIGHVQLVVLFCPRGVDIISY